MTVPRPSLVDQLTGARVAFLCTLRPDGSPHQTPVWFVFTDPLWWVATAATNVKVRNVRVDSRISIAVADLEAPIVAEGSASIHSMPWPAEVIAAFAQKYSWDVTDNVPDGQRVLIAITTNRWVLAPT
jgi:PPOX class probable F420-dependent enzyme